MNKTPESQPGITRLQKVAIVLFLALFLIAVLGALFASIWFLPSPWCYTGAFVAAGMYWLIQRESFVETLVIVVLLLVIIALLREPILQLKGKMNIGGEAAINMLQRSNG